MSASVGTRVVIVGGGPAGAAVALTLARAGLSPVVLEAQTGPRTKVGECLPPSANLLLARLGLIERVSRAGLPSHGNRFLWGSAEPAERDFIFNPAGAGRQLDRRRFEEELACAAVEAGADWRYGRRLVGCSRVGEAWELQFTTTKNVDEHRVELDGRRFETCRADFIVDASGRSARLARLLGARRVRYDRLVGVAAYFDSDLREDSGAGQNFTDSFTLVEATASGWWYSARLPGGRLVAAYMTDSDLVVRDEARRAEGWLALLEQTEHTRRRVGEGVYKLSTSPRVLAAHTSRLSAVAGEGWLAAGDAAAAFDPLASYGITAALGAGFYAAAAVADYLAGRREALNDYARLIDRAFADYLVMRHERYLAERRWPDSIFWQRRQHTPRAASQTSPAPSASNFQSPAAT